MKLEESIAKFNLGELVISQFPKIALETLQSGIESESLVILAGMNDRDNSFEIREYLDYVIEELGIVSYQSLEAAFVLANAYIESFKKNKIDVIECIYRIKNECWDNCPNLISSNEYLFDGIQFHQIIGTWYQYYEIDGWTEWVKKSGKGINELKAEAEKDLEKLILEWQTEFLERKLQSIKR